MPFDVQELSYCFDTQKVVDSISIKMNSGLFYGILGPNGSGKTTFLDLLSRHKQATSGQIFYKGEKLGNYSRKGLSREIALVPQNYYINFPFTALEVVLMGRYPHMPKFAAPSDYDLQMVEKAMQTTGTLQFKDRLISELSGGERQRVVFARALAQDTPVLMLDEATSNLDIKFALHVLQVAAEQNGQGQADNKTIISVFQDINLAAAFCDYLVFMREGQIATHGPAKEVLSNETLKQVFDVEAKVYFEPYSNSKHVVFKK